MSYLLGAYLPGNSLLHRAPADAKLLGLLVFSTLLVVLHGLVATGVLFGVAVVVTLVARLPMRQVGRAARGVLLIALVLSALQGYAHGWPRAVEAGVDLLSLALGGLILTATTEVNAMLDLFTRLITPLKPIGVNPDGVALVIGLAITSIPASIALLLETRDAARARGIRHPRAYLSPFVIRVVARAHETGDALKARGLGD
ncbi:MAG: energy-coupling factor transporter transmembrane protein EcfT [Actinomycetota bacterium]|nr:energy-coupling factor transporter transmembrane protein EcfT [Actinomycetota bacterium]